MENKNYCTVVKYFYFYCLTFSFIYLYERKVMFSSALTLSHFVLSKRNTGKRATEINSLSARKGAGTLIRTQKGLTVNIVLSFLS